MPRSNWSIYIEGIGETHNGLSDDANKHMMDCLKALEKYKHNTILQARFSSARGEENWMDPSIREMHEELCEKCQGALPEDNWMERAKKKRLQEQIDHAPSDISPHDELVKMGANTNASSKQSPATVGIRQPEQKDKRGQSGKGLYPSDTKGGI